MHRRALRSLTALAATFLPGSPRLPSAIGLEVPQRFEGAILDMLSDPAQRRDLLLFLHLLDTRFGGLMLYGQARRFTRLEQEGREAAVRRMARSPSSMVRLGVKALKGAIGMLYMNPPQGHQGDWQPWVVLGYPSTPPAPSKPIDRIPVGHLGPGESKSVDVVVVGSGAGGATAAAVLAGAGLKVAVVEAGGYLDRADFPRRETDALHSMYLDGALGTTTDGAITMVAGATLGGGTVVNYSTALPTPEWLRDQWDGLSGFDSVFTGEQFAESLAVVTRRTSVTEEESQPSKRDALMEQGLRSLGWHVSPLPRNVRGCDPVECGNCIMGCRLGAKQSATETWLRDGVSSGAEIYVEAPVDRILVENGRAVGVEVKVDGGTAALRAGAVVLAAGALHTPAILLRSRVGGPAIGRYLHLHPVTAVWGRFEERVEQWSGILQARYSDEFADLDGEGYGFKFETTAVHHSFPPLLFGFDSGVRFQSDLEALGHWSPIGILLRDHGAGWVTLGKDGRPRWGYRFHRADLEHFGIAVEKAAAVLEAAGADEVMASTLRAVRWKPGEDGGSAAGFGARARRAGLGANRCVYVSLHQMSSARMGRDPRTSVVGRWNEAHDLPGLFVVDASAFPSASGVNPALTIQAIAHRAATRLAERLT